MEIFPEEKRYIVNKLERIFDFHYPMFFPLKEGLRKAIEGDIRFSCHDTN